MSFIKYQRGTSLWVARSPQEHYPSLAGDIDIDVAIIGGGIAGLTSAYLLKQAGLSVAVIEKGIIGGGTTGHTTGKVTSQHSLIYSRLYGHMGKEAARMYGQANQAAVELVKKIIADEEITCDWRDEDNYVFTENPEKVAQFKHEFEVAESLGLPATFETQTPLPFPVCGAVRFRNQGTFHARKYVLALARAVNGAGSYVFEHTKAIVTRDGTPASILTSGGTVRARHVIVATLVPYSIPAHTAYGIVEYPLASYIVATHTEHQLAGMYITPDDQPFSILPVTIDGERLLLIGGQGHIPGLGRAKPHYDRLMTYARDKFQATPTKYRWLAWDYLAYDKLPVIGKLYPWSRNVYVATGFMKWGLTNATVAGVILRDAITGQENAWAPMFDSTRTSTVASIPSFLAKLPKLIG